MAWILGEAVGTLGALVFAELATRHPQAGGRDTGLDAGDGRARLALASWRRVLERTRRP